MKRLILIVLISIISVPLFSQESLNLINEDKLWSTINQACMPGWYISAYHKVEGDTLINDTLYTKLWKCDVESMLSWYIKGFVRSEENAKYYFRSINGHEGLVYDFDVEVGEFLTIDNPFHYTSIDTEVLEIDSVLLVPGGEKRKRIKLAADQYGIDEYWIEGVGSNAGIIWSGFHILSLTGGQYYALCHWENNELMQTNPSYNFCFENTIGVDENSQQKPKIRLFPSPLVDQSSLRIENSQHASIEVEISNVYGRIVKYYRISNDEVILQRNDFVPGIYIINVSENRKKIEQLKFLVY